MNGLEARVRCEMADIPIQHVHVSSIQQALVGASPMLSIVLMYVADRYTAYDVIMVERADGCVYLLSHDGGQPELVDVDSVLVIDAYAVFCAQRYRTQVYPTLVSIIVVCVVLLLFCLMVVILWTLK